MGRCWGLCYHIPDSEVQAKSCHAVTRHKSKLRHVPSHQIYLRKHNHPLHWLTQHLIPSKPTSFTKDKFNYNGLPHKLPEITHFMKQNNISIAVLQETKLISRVNITRLYNHKRGPRKRQGRKPSISCSSWRQIWGTCSKGNRLFYFY